MSSAPNSAPSASNGIARLSRREWLTRVGPLLLSGLSLPFAGCAGGVGASRSTGVRPRIFWRGQADGRLRTVEAVRRSIERPGQPREIWKGILAACQADAGTPPLTCRSSLPDRPAVMARQNNPDYTICRAAGQRILRQALAFNLTSKEAFKRDALAQMEALFDASVWPDWIDQSHLRFELPADLRTGMLSQDTALAFDWLYPFLDNRERAMIVEGLDRRGIQPYLRSMAADPWWAHDLNNWYTVIIGGLGIAGMALGSAHPEAARLVEMSLPRMRRYLSIYGKDGSFNESVAYSNATRIPVAYFYAYFYHTGGADNPLVRPPFPQTAEWTVYATLPPGRFACFGDGWPERPPEVAFMTALAAATGHPVLQDYALLHMGETANPYYLLWLDAELPGHSPQGVWPLGKAFPENSALFFSRSSWDPQQPEMVVYGKAKRAQNHGHNDLGQLCIDVLGRRLIIDPGSPSSYPADFFDAARFEYYNASVRGHNVLMFGGREQRHPPHDRGVKGLLDLEPMNGRIRQSGFDDPVGGFWQIDLTRAYDGVLRVVRTVIHLLPGWVAVLDEAELEQAEAVSLRWHTIVPSPPDAEGHFRVAEGAARLACQLVVLEGANREPPRLLQHAYQAPYDRDRTGEKLEQRHEPYVEQVLRDQRCRILTLFAKEETGRPARWHADGDKWFWSDGRNSAEAACGSGFLELSHRMTGRSLRVEL